MVCTEYKYIVDKKMLHKGSYLVKTLGRVKNMKKVVVYYRDRKGGKTLDYQQKIAADWVSERDFQTCGQVIETEGASKRCNRPELERALRLAKLQKAILFIPTFGQMSRNADIIGKMINHGVEVCTPDVASLREPGATRDVLKVMASVAEFEVGETKQRAKEAYARIKDEIKDTGKHTTKKGKVITSLGNIKTTQLAAVEAIKVRLANKMDYAAEIQPMLNQLYARGCRSAGDFARSLTAKKIVSPRGRTAWTASMARNVLENCGMRSEPRLDAKLPENIIEIGQFPRVTVASEDIEKTVMDNFEMTTSMIRRRFGIPYGVINRILGR